jgi:uncharacterized protein (TIGR02466 family)
MENPDIQTYHLFPTPVMFFKYEKKLSEETLNFLKTAEQIPNRGNKSSKDTYILNNPILKDLSLFINRSIKEYFISIHNPSDTSLKVELTQSWLNWSEPGEYHHEHYHCNSFLSGVFYVNADKNKDKICFVKNDIMLFDFSKAEHNMYNSDNWWLPVGSNELIIFPSSLKHRVDTVESGETRISLAFNTYPRGRLGNEVALTAARI